MGPVVLTKSDPPEPHNNAALRSTDGSWLNAALGCSLQNVKMPDRANYTVSKAAFSSKVELFLKKTRFFCFFVV